MTILDLTEKLNEKRESESMFKFLEQQLNATDLPLQFPCDTGLDKLRKELMVTTDCDVADFDRRYRTDQSFKGSRGAKKLPSTLSYRDLSDIMVKVYAKKSKDIILETLDSAGTLRYDDVYTVSDKVNILHFFTAVLEAVEQHSEKNKCES